MSDITPTIIRHREKTLALGRNVAAKLLFEKSPPKKPKSQRAVSAVREFWVTSSLRLRAS